MKNKFRKYDPTEFDQEALYQWYLHMLNSQDSYTHELSNDYRMIDGSGNNVNYDGAGGQFLRIAPSDYDDGFETLAGQSRPSAREISNELFATDVAIPDSGGLSNMMWLWGQFVDHDIDLTRDGQGAEYEPIAVPSGDPFFDPMGTGTEVIHLFRSGFDETTGEDFGVPREQVNEITAFLDASGIYGSDEIRNAALRDEGGKLKLSEGDLLPFNEPMLPNAPSDSPFFFLAGDVRANENVGLTSMHTLFVREHNRLVDEIKSQHPELTDEELYQQAKMIVEAQIQAITYNDFLPLLLGPDALDAYSGFDPTVDPEIANIFATAAYRLGHSMLSNQLLRLDEAGDETADGHLSLRDAFFNPLILSSDGSMDAILRGMSGSVEESIDIKIIDDVRNFLFGEPGEGGFDLGALNIQRGRDHGLPDYNSAREAYGLDKVTDFSDITSDPVLQQLLFELYGDVNNIDVFVGGLAEDPYPGSQLGELFHTILVDQFSRLRDGDYYFYENRLSGELLDQINDTHLSDIILRNTDIDYLQQNVFITYLRVGGNEKNNHVHGTDGKDLVLGFDGNDFLKGFADDDEIYGGAGKDKLYGQDGNDLLNGEAGNDLLYGGQGSDTFVLAPLGGYDKVMDFSLDDKIDVSAYHIGYDDLIIKAYGVNTVVSAAVFADDHLELLGFAASDLTVDNFIF